MAEEAEPSSSEPQSVARRCPYCGLESAPLLDPRFRTEVYVWRCVIHGLFAYLIFRG